MFEIIGKPEYFINGINYLIYLLISKKKKKFKWIGYINKGRLRYYIIVASWSAE